MKRITQIVLFALLCGGSPADGQSPGLDLVLEDESGAALPRARVSVLCAGKIVEEHTADEEGAVKLQRHPGCTITVTADGFAERTMAWETVVLEPAIRMRPASTSASVVVTARGGEIATSATTAHGVVDADRLARIPVFSAAAGFSEMLTRTTPGVAADSNGFAHPLGEHADTSISLDGQPMTDQIAKIFANQLDTKLIASLDAITGAPPAEFGGKTSLVVSVTSKSGLGHAPGAELSTEYGSFGSATQSLMTSAGGQRWGEFLVLSAAKSGRFLDTPEFRPMHAQGNVESVFNRVDWRPREADSIHLNLGGGRSWFQTPNSYDTAAAGQDQRSQIRNTNAAAGWSHVVSPELLVSLTPFFRHDRAQYFSSDNPFADKPATLAQDRTLTNTGFRVETIYNRGPQTLKAGSTYWHTLLHERFSVGLTDAAFNAPCSDAEGEPVAETVIRDTSQCLGAGYEPNPDFLARLLPYDLTRGGAKYLFDRSADIEEAAFYAQDELRLGSVQLNLGLRYDIYNGLSRGRGWQPRLGMGWRAPWTGTRVRLSYSRIFETPYNENLIFANESTADNSTSNPFGSFRSEPVQPGTRNQFNVGFEQSFGKHVTVDADYYWKFTHTAFDFDTLFNTPITFSVALRKSKIDGLALRTSLNDWHGLNVSTVMGHVRARFFTPQVGGLIFNSTPGAPVFRIDHGEEFEQTTEARYELPGKRKIWTGLSWRYNSGLALPDTVPMYTDALKLTADEQQQMGLHCGSTFATPTQPVRSCTAEQFGATRIRIPAPGTQDEDRNPVRVTPRTLLDLSTGADRVLKVERLQVGLRFTVINLTNKVALYNFLSTFSGTHFVPPRSLQMGMTIGF